MTIREINLDEVQAAYDGFVQSAMTDLTQLGVKSEILKQLQAEIAELERQRAATLANAKFLAEVHVILLGVPDDVAELRKRFSDIGARRTRSDATSDKERQLALDQGEVREALRKSCPHPFVLVRKPAHHSEGDLDGFCGCVICGLSKIDDDLEGNNSTFPVDPYRIRRDLAQEYLPLGGSLPTLVERLFHYAALGTVSEIQELFLGEQRRAKLKELLKSAQEPSKSATT